MLATGSASPREGLGARSLLATLAQRPAPCSTCESVCEMEMNYGVPNSALEQCDERTHAHTHTHTARSQQEAPSLRDVFITKQRCTDRQTRGQTFACVMHSVEGCVRCIQTYASVATSVISKRVYVSFCTRICTQRCVRAFLHTHCEHNMHTHREHNMHTHCEHMTSQHETGSHIGPNISRKRNRTPSAGA